MKKVKMVDFSETSDLKVGKCRQIEFMKVCEY